MNGSTRPSEMAHRKFSLEPSHDLPMICTRDAAAPGIATPGYPRAGMISVCVFSCDALPPRMRSVCVVHSDLTCLNEVIVHRRIAEAAIVDHASRFAVEGRCRAAGRKAKTQRADQ